MYLARILLFFLFIMYSLDGNSQKERIDWLSFEQLEDSLSKEPKKVFLSFYADWCAYCKKMDESAFKDPNVIALLNKEYYAVKMHAESRDTISFLGQRFVNKNVGKSRTPFHELPLLIGSRENATFSLPVNMILDESLSIKRRHFEYLSPKELLKFLSKK